MSLTIVVIFVNCHQPKNRKGNGGDPWTDGGEVHLNGMITSMDIRKAINVQIIFLMIISKQDRVRGGFNSSAVWRHLGR